MLPAGNIRGYIVQRAHFIHIEAPVNRFHLKPWQEVDVIDVTFGWRMVILSGYRVENTQWHFYRFS